MQKRLVALVALIVFGFAVYIVLAQSTTTPNLGLNIPLTGTANWGQLMNANFSALDNYLSGGVQVPGSTFLTTLGMSGVGGGVFCNTGVMTLSGGTCFLANPIASGSNQPSQAFGFVSNNGGSRQQVDIMQDAAGDLQVVAAAGSLRSFNPVAPIANGAVTFANLPSGGAVSVGMQIFCTGCVSTTPATCSTNTPASCVCASGTGSVLAKYENFQNAGVAWYCN